MPKVKVWRPEPVPGVFVVRLKDPHAAPCDRHITWCCYVRARDAAAARRKFVRHTTVAAGYAPKVTSVTPLLTLT
jgi:hypothetical protein